MFSSYCVVCSEVGIELLYIKVLYYRSSLIKSLYLFYMKISSKQQQKFESILIWKSSASSKLELLINKPDGRRESIIKKRESKLIEKEKTSLDQMELIF